MTTSIPKPRTTSFVSSMHSPTTISIPLGCRVVLTKRRSGYVRYIGKLKNEGGEWYGIALDDGKGDSDGSHEKERYFDCPANTGVFVRRKEIFCVKEAPVRSTKNTGSSGPPSPIANDVSDNDSSTSSSIDSHDTTTTSPMQQQQQQPTKASISTPATTNYSSAAQQATAVITPFVRTFKSFRKELGLQLSPTKIASNNHQHSTTNAPKSQSTTASPAHGATRSSGLRSPSIRRLNSFSSSPTSSTSTSRTASIVSQMLVTPLESPTRLAATPPLTPQLEPAEPADVTEQVEQLLERTDLKEQLQRPQEQMLGQSTTESSVAELLNVSSSISSLSDLYHTTAVDKTPSAAPTHSPPRIARLSSSTVSATEAVARPLSPPPPSSACAPSPAANTSAMRPASSGQCDPSEQQRHEQLQPQDLETTASSVVDVLNSISNSDDNVSNLADEHSDAPVEFVIPEAPVVHSPSRIARLVTTTSSSASKTTPRPHSPLSPAAANTSTSPTRTSHTMASFSSTTAVETIPSPRRTEPAPAPLFFRRAHVGSPTQLLSRRASFSNAGGNGNGAASPTSTSSTTSSIQSSPTYNKTSPSRITTAAAATNARLVELEREMSAMKTNHENVVAVLRASNQQHAANVLELRAQVDALSAGNKWLETSLAAKSALVAEFQAMEHNGERVPRAEVERLIALKDAQIQTLAREVAKLKQHLVRIETAKDSVLCQQMRSAARRQEADESRINRLREDVLAMCTERSSLQSELQDLKAMSFLF